MIRVTDKGLIVNFGPDLVARPDLLRQKMTEAQLLLALNDAGKAAYFKTKAHIEAAL